MRLRIVFSKSETLRYIGHLDLHRIWERTCRRAGIPLSYSQGFHPQPRISLAAALPLGFIGQAEVMDLWLEKEEDLMEVLKSLQAAAPPGLKLNSIQLIEQSQAALQTQVTFADYEVLFLDPVDPIMLSSKLDGLLSSTEIFRQRRSKEYNMRELISSITINHEKGNNQVSLLMRLSASPGATGRPEEILSELGYRFEDTRITRIRLILNE